MVNDHFEKRASKAGQMGKGRKPPASASEPDGAGTLERLDMGALQPSNCGRIVSTQVGATAIQCRGTPVSSSRTSNDRNRSNNAVLR